MFSVLFIFSLFSSQTTNLVGPSRTTLYLGFREHRGTHLVTYLSYSVVGSWMTGNLQTQV